MAKVVIIGAGLTGLSTAYHLEKNGYYDYAIFEKEASIGGLCRTVLQDGFTFDFTGHLLHVNDPYFQALLEEILAPNSMNSIDRRSFIYSHKTYTPYPFQMNLHGLPTSVIAECLQGFLTRNKKQKADTFYQWVLKSFGQGFGNHFFFPYQQKIFAYDIKKISASWTGRFVPATSLEQIIDGALSPASTKNVGYNAQFLYPKQGGIVSWVNKLAAAITNPIHSNHTVQSIDMRTQRITFTNGHSESYEHLISTMPLDTLLAMTTERSSSTAQRALPHLKCNSVVNFNIGVNHPDLSDKHWIYFPEKQYPFYRIGFPHNFAAFMTPPGCSSLYGEFAHFNRSYKKVGATLREAIAATKKLLSIQDADIVTEKILYIPHAYVLYTAWREKHLASLLSHLKAESISSVGRYGEWKYASMQEAVLDGKKVAEDIMCQLSSRPEQQYTHQKKVL